MRDINQFVKSEIEKWKKELLISSDVGGPCEDDYVKWNEKYPESYYGLPDTIQFKTVDMNDDGKDDILLYFPAGEACTGGHEEGSDFLKLIYSSKNEYLQNNDLRATIEKEIRFLSDRQTGAFSRSAIFSVTNIDKQIIGTFQVWTDDDPDCCAGYEGTFEYNPFTWRWNSNNIKFSNRPNKIGWIILVFISAIKTIGYRYSHQ
jgi:hypothetical protein